MTNLRVIAFMHWWTLSLVGNQFIGLNTVGNICYILFSLRKNRVHLFCIIFIFFFVFQYDLGTKLSTRSQNVAESWHGILQSLLLWIFTFLHLIFSLRILLALRLLPKEFSYSLACEKKWFSFIITRMNTLFVINKPVTGIFKVFIK